MKKFLLLFAFFGLVALVDANAQCSSAQKTAQSEKSAHCTKSAMAKAASMDASVEKRVCPHSGTVSYVRKNVCATSGTVSFTNVEFCSKSGKFVNVSPSKKASCSKKAAEGAKATKASNAATKPSCCSGADKPGCCDKKTSCDKSKGAKADAAKGNANVKLIKNNQ